MQIIAGREIITPEGVRVGPAHSRVLSLLVEWTSSGDHFVVSDAFANAFVVRRVQVWCVWKVQGVGPLVDFKLTTGVGHNLTWQQASDWDSIVPVVMEGGGVASWMANLQSWHYDWPMQKPYSGQGRRLAVTCRQFDDSDVWFYTSFEIEEG